MAVCHLYPTKKIYKGGHETPRGCILLREHGGNMVSDFLVFIFINMLEFSLDVACGANKFLYFTLNMTFSRSFVGGRPQGQKVEAFWSNNNENH